MSGKIISRPYTPEGEDTYERVFGKKEVNWEPLTEFTATKEECKDAFLKARYKHVSYGGYFKDGKFRLGIIPEE